MSSSSQYVEIDILERNFRKLRVSPVLKIPI